jgi:hypothetical protein
VAEVDRRQKGEFAQAHCIAQLIVRDIEDLQAREVGDFGEGSCELVVREIETGQLLQSKQPSGERATKPVVRQIQDGQLSESTGCSVRITQRACETVVRQIEDPQQVERTELGRQTSGELIAGER